MAPLKSAGTGTCVVLCRESSVPEAFSSARVGSHWLTIILHVV